MPSLLSTRRFTVNDGVGDTTVYPVNSGLKYRWQLEEGGRFYRKRLQTKLLFRGADYTFFKALFDAGDCALITILIEVYCGGAWREEFTGKIVVGQGEYHIDRCEVTYDVQAYDAYDCFKRALKKSINWLSLTDPVTVLPIYGTRATETCTYSGIEFGSPTGAKMFLKDCWSGGSFDTTESIAPDATERWRPIEHDKIYDPDGTPELDITTIWAREEVTQVGAPPGNGWVNQGGNDWARPIPLALTYLDTLYPYLSGDRYLYGATNPEDDISNGRYLPDLLPEVLAELECDSVTEVRSDFFGINPPGDAPSNTAYTFASVYLQDVVLFQKSDIVNDDASTDATTLHMNLNDFLVSLRDAFNVYWSLEPIGGGDFALRIEHWSYFEAANGTDLTVDHPLSVVGNNSFKSNLEIPNSEIFNFQESFNTAFLKSQITYPIACSDSEQDIDYSLSTLSCDVGGLLRNSSASLTGFVLVSTVDLGDGTYLIDNTNDQLNGAMAWDTLHNELWVFGRYSETADSTATGGALSVESTRRFREQQRITFKYCCQETDFDPVQLVKSGLGWGQIKDIEHDTEKDQMSVILLH